MSDATLVTLDDTWIFVALFRCARCGSHVKILHHERDGTDRRGFRDTRLCNGCRAPIAT